jgi:diaminopimelate decarboxylase
MATINYNSYPQAPEVMRRRDGSLGLVRRRQTLDEMLVTLVDEAGAR